MSWKCPPWLRWTVYGLAFAGVGLVYFIATIPDVPERVALIQLGMTRAEVEAVLGHPAGDYATGPHFYLIGIGHVTRYADGTEKHIWLFDGCVIYVWFDANQCVQ